MFNMAQMVTYTKEQYRGWVYLDEWLQKVVRTVHPTPLFVIPTHIPVAFDPPDGYEDKYPWKPGESVLFIGEIFSMPGHGTFVGDDGLVRWGYHLENFRVIPAEEL